MADDTQGRADQADDADRRQRERALVEAMNRMDEPEPPIPEETLEPVEAELETLSFPATAADVVAAVGDQEIAGPDETYRVAELVPETEAETFDEPAELRAVLRRPTIAATMARIVEASDPVPHVTLAGSQQTAYLRTLQELKAIDADDDDEGVRAIGDWIVERIEEKQALPGSRAVRREAATFCRRNGYPIRNDEWLGV